MRAPICVALLGLAALLAARVGLSFGVAVAFVASPVALALAWCAYSVRDGITTDHPRRIVGAGIATAVVGVCGQLAGAGPAALLAVATGAALVFAAGRAAMGFEPPPAGVEPAPVSATAQTLAVALDEAVALWWELTRGAPAPGSAPGVAADVRAAAHRNHEEGWTDHPERSHLAPPPLSKAGVRVAEVRGAGRALHLTFASEFEPQDEEVRTAYLDARANRTAHAYLWRHAGAPRPTLLCIHGYEMGRIGSDARRWSVDWLHRQLGFDVALFVLPLHGERSLGRRSGAGFLDGHPLFTAAAMSQAVWDLRRIGGWLRGDGAPLVGVLGAGVGGCVAAVLASVDEGLACAVPIAPVAPLENLLWRQLSPAGRAELRAGGLNPHLLSRAWARHSPLRMRPRVSHSARFVVGGLADRVARSREVAALWEHWGRPGIHWSPGSHSAWLDRGEVRRRIAAHLRTTLSVDREA